MHPDLPQDASPTTARRPAAGNPWEPTPYAAGATTSSPAPSGPVTGQRANRHALRTALAVGLLILGLALVGQHLTVGVTAYGIGRMLVSVLVVPAVIAALIVRTRPRRWSWWKYLPLQIGISVLMTGFAGLGQLAALQDPETRISALPVDQMKQGSREAQAGIFTAAESDCIIDGLVQQPGLTLGAIEEYFRSPQPGLVDSAYAAVVPSCIDPAAVVQSGPLHPMARQSFLNGLGAGLPDATEQETACVLDALLGRGVTARQLTLAGYDEAVLQQLAPHFETVSAACLPASAAG